MSKGSLKYNPYSELKKRTKLSEPSNCVSYSNLFVFSNKFLEHKKFTEKDLGNGFKEFVIKN